MSRFQERLKEIEAEGARSKSSRLAELLPEIEAALSKGFSRAHVVDALKAEGIAVTPSLLSSYLQRFRHRQRSAFTTPSAAAPSPSPSADSSATPPAAATPETPDNPSPAPAPYDPAGLRAIARNRPDLKELARIGREARANEGRKKDPPAK
jgi:hypothetical protein